MKAIVEKVCMAVQVDGKSYAVALPQDRLLMLVQLAESLSDDGKLKLAPLPVGFEFRSITEGQP